MKKSVRLAAVCLALTLAAGYVLVPAQSAISVEPVEMLLFAGDNPIPPPTLPPAPPPPTVA